ncbi:MAG: VOC family protein [Planctomycetes bacterium]|nr:VOC family protein [Planctomycetota bacterium]
MSTSTQDLATTETATTPQVGSIVHIEFTTPDLAKAKAFYGELFGWEFQPFQPTEWYFQTPKGWGPCGCVIQGPAAGDARTMLYVNVDDIPATLARALDLGAKTIKDKTEIPGGHGWFAQLQAPDGNVWGIYCRA